MTPIRRLTCRTTTSHFTNVPSCAEPGFHRRDPAYFVSWICVLGCRALLQLLNLNLTLTRYMTEVIVRCPMAIGHAPLELVAELAQKLTAVKDLTVCAGVVQPDLWFWAFDADLEHIRQLHNAILPMLQAPTLATLTLKDISFTAKELFHQFICIPSLVTLILENVSLSLRSDWMSDTGLDHGGLVPTTQLRLAISALALHSQDAALVPWLLHRSCPVNVAALRELSIQLKDVGNMHDLLPLLNAIGGSLKVFGIRLPSRCDFNEYRCFSEIMDAIPTLPNTHIEHIFISGFDRQDPSIGDYSKHFDGADFVKSLLLRLPAPQRLQRVTINESVEIIWHSVKEFPKLQWHNWRAVDDVLAQDLFSNVKYLDFLAGLNALELRCDDVRSCITPQFRTFQERKGTVFSLTVDYTSSAWVMFDTRVVLICLLVGASKFLHPRGYLPKVLYI
ncbi:hypothetical protein B0H10DRAFT_1958678 [Mycena sp. CBHHK59/15]|nr:hypothetical protein B0H10DRAFT_1958678 [Mycena sp. CBHHK59/15]